MRKKAASSTPVKLNVKHHISSTYHLESQGALKSFHQALKTAMRKFCAQLSNERSSLLFTVRETPQESLGYCPVDLLFGQCFSTKSSSKQNIPDYVCLLKERFSHAWAFACKMLSRAQTKMKCQYDWKSVMQLSNAGDRVLVLLPVCCLLLQNLACSPGQVLEVDTNYLIQTANRKKKSSHQDAKAVCGPFTVQQLSVSRCSCSFHVCPALNL